MYLNKYEEKMYNGEYGDVLARAIRAIVKVGESIGARRLVNISHAHISGVGYGNIGEAGLSLLRDIVSSGTRFLVYTTANPGSVDIESHSVFPYREEFFKKQLEILEYYRTLGARTFTCTPYHVREPDYGEHLAWAESNAVLVANSIYGARTNKESGVMALFSALTGKTYYGGLHLKRNRIPRVVFVARDYDNTYLYAGLLGLYIGRVSRDRIPAVRGLGRAGIEKLKTFLAAVGTTGSQGMVYIEGVSSEDYSPYEYEKYVEERIEVERRDIERFSEETEYLCDEPDAYLIGCPHASIELLREVRALLNKVSGTPRRPVWLLVPPDYTKIEEVKRLLDEIASRGVHVVKGVCPVISPLSELGYKCIGTLSSKAFFYLPRLARTRVALMDLPELVYRAYGIYQD